MPKGSCVKMRPQLGRPLDDRTEPDGMPRVRRGLPWFRVYSALPRPSAAKAYGRLSYRIEESVTG